MPSFLLENAVSGTGVRADMGADIFATTLVATQSYQLSTDSNAILGTGDFQRVTVQGYVMAVANAGVQLSGEGGFISISATGVVANSGTDLEAAVRTYGIEARIVNAGEISGGVGVGLYQGGNIVNSGSITAVGTTYGADPEASAGIVLAASASTNMRIVNTGLISGAVQEQSDAYDGQRFSIWEARGQANTIRIENSGTLNGTVDLLDGAATLRNTGTILGAVRLGGSVDELNNAGTVNEDVDLGDGADRLENTGALTRNVFLGEGADIAVVGGTVSVMYGGTGADLVAISGAVLSGVFLEDGADTLFLTGAGRAFDVAVGDGNDSLYGGQSKWPAVWSGRQRHYLWCGWR